MKILMVNKFLYPKGGAETYVLRLGGYLARAGHDVEYFGMEDARNTVGNSAGAYTQNMDFHSGGIEKLLYPLRIVYSLHARRKIRAVIERFRPDIIHMNNINFQLTPAVIDEAWRMGVPVVQTVHDLQMLCPNHLMFDLRTKAPCEKCLHGTRLHCIQGRCIHGSRAKSVIGAAEAWLYSAKRTYDRVERYICPSRFLEQKLLEKERYRGKTTVLHNFIELPEVNPASSSKDYVLFFGRISEEKGIELLLDACARLPHIRFLAAGTGPLEGRLAGLSNLEYVGFQSGKALWSLIANAKFTVYPSIWYENCPLSILESEAAGTPVICTGLGGMPELVEHGRTGLILRRPSGEDLAEAVEFLWESPEQLEQMSLSCLEKRRTMLTLDGYGQKILSLYAEALGLPGLSPDQEEAYPKLEYKP